MELWFSDYHTDKVKMSVKVEKQLFGEQTDFQRIDVLIQRNLDDLSAPMEALYFPRRMSLYMTR